MRFLPNPAALDQNNRLFTLARQGLRQPSAVEAVAVTFGVIALVIPGQIVSRLAVRLIFPSGIGSIASPIVEDTIGFLPVYLSLFVWLRFSIKRPFWTVGLENPGAVRKALRGALIAAFMLAVTAGLAMIPGASLAPGSQASAIAALGLGLVSLVSYLAQGPAEEVLFRGWLLPVIGSRYRPWIGVLVSAVLFSFAHGLSSGITPLAFLNLFLFGVFAAVYALAEGGLWGIGVWHAVWNWAMGNLLGFPLDGSPHQGLLISIRATGPDTVTGGAFGLEGGLTCTAVFLIAIGITARLSRYSGNGPFKGTGV